MKFAYLDLKGFFSSSLLNIWGLIFPEYHKDPPSLVTPREVWKGVLEICQCKRQASILMPLKLKCGGSQPMAGKLFPPSFLQCIYYKWQNLVSKFWVCSLLQHDWTNAKFCWKGRMEGIGDEGDWLGCHSVCHNLSNK